MLTITDIQRSEYMRALLGPRSSTASSDLIDAAGRQVDTAVEVLGAYIAGSEKKIPRNLLNTVILTVARELETREKSPGGVFAAFGETDTPIRLARDPLITVYPLLARFIGGGFA